MEVTTDDASFFEKLEKEWQEILAKMEESPPQLMLEFE